MQVSIIRLLKKLSLAVVAVVALLALPTEVRAQRLALKTNAVEYLILSPNLTFEARLNRKLSFQLGLAVNPITKPIAGITLANLRVEPELRYWFNRPMARHFVAFSATAGAYNIRLKEHYFKGDAVGAGFSYGYALVLSKHWNMEAEIGVGFCSFKGYNHTGEYKDRPRDKNFSRIYPVPIRFGLSFSYIFE